MVDGVARQLRLKYYVRDGDIPDDERIADILCGEGVKVYEWPFLDEPKEVYIEGVIGLIIGLSRPWRRWYLLHGLAHHLLHHGNQFYLWEHDRVTLARQECMADLLAGYVLLGSEVRLGMLGQAPVTAYVLAEAAEVPVEMVARWWQLVGGDVGLANTHRRTGTD